MNKFKQELLTRFQGTDEGEVKEYPGREVLRDRAARTGKLVQAGYAERVLRTFGMCDCNPVLTPLDPNVRLTKQDLPEVVDPRLHRQMRSIVECLSYLGISLASMVEQFRGAVLDRAVSLSAALKLSL